MRVETIDCLTGTRGEIANFPAELRCADGSAGAHLRLAPDGNGVCVSADFRASGVRFAGKTLLGAETLAAGVPAILQLKDRVIALCVPAAGEGENSAHWSAHYRFPLWTLFEPETFEAIAAVRSPDEIPAALQRERLEPRDCLAAPYGVPVSVPLAQIFEILCGNAGTQKSAGTAEKNS